MSRSSAALDYCSSPPPRPPLGPRKAYYLTRGQRATYEAVRMHLSAHAKGPTLRELGMALRIPQLARITSYLRSLQRWGFVAWEAGDLSTLSITRPLPVEGEPLRRPRSL